MVCYSSHVLKSKLPVPYSKGKLFSNHMVLGYQTFYHGCLSNGPAHSISDHLNTEQVKVCYSNPNCTIWIIFVVSQKFETKHYLDRLLSVSVFVKLAFSVPDMSTPSSWNSLLSLLTLRLRLAGAVVRPITGFFVLEVRCSFFNSFFLIRILKINIAILICVKNQCTDSKQSKFCNSNPL